MLIKLAWRSIWRNKRRTLITVLSIAIGLTITIFFISLGEGMYGRLIDQVARLQAGHITLQHPDYNRAPAVDLTVGLSQDFRNRVEAWPEVERTKLLVIGQGIAKSGAGNVPAAIVGVEPSVELLTSPLARKMVAGSYLEDEDQRLVVVGRELADRLNVEVGKKMVLTTNDAHGELVEQLVRVKGLFQTGSEEIDAYFVQAPLNFAAERLFHLPKGHVTQMGVILKDADDQKKIMDRLQKELAGQKVAVLPWQEVMPEVASYIRLDRASNYIFQAILIFLILFTIFNTILMSVMERRHEFAVLLAVGTTGNQLRLQLFMESFFLGLIGCASGLVFGALAAYLGHVYGIDMTAFLTEGVSISGFALEPKLITKLSAGIIFSSAALVFIAILLISFIPMRHGTKVAIAEVLR